MNRLFRLITPPLLSVFSVVTILGCGSINQLAKHEFDDNFYTLKSTDIPAQKIFAKIENDSIFVYTLMDSGRTKVPDPVGFKTIGIGDIKPGGYLYHSTFSRSYFDVDLTTILLKYRMSRGHVPPQLNANLNAAIYIGYKKDYFKIKSSFSPLKEKQNSVHQLNFDTGLFVGFGMTPINPTVTNNKVELEYDGIFFQKGIAVFIGFENYNFGLGIGFDNLLDSNHRSWIYDQRPWFGFFMGIANF